MPRLLRRAPQQARAPEAERAAAGGQKWRRDLARVRKRIKEARPRFRLPTAQGMVERVVEQLKTQTKKLILGTATTFVVALTATSILRQRFGAYAEAARARTAERRERARRLKEARLATASPLRHAVGNLRAFLAHLLDDTDDFRAFFVEHADACVDDVSFKLGTLCHFIVGFYETAQQEGMSDDDLWEYNTSRALAGLIKAFSARTADLAATYDRPAERLACALVAASARFAPPDGCIARMHAHDAGRHLHRAPPKLAQYPLRILYVDIRAIGETMRDVCAEERGRVHAPSLIRFLAHVAESDAKAEADGQPLCPDFAFAESPAAEEEYASACSDPASLLFHEQDRHPHHRPQQQHRPHTSSPWATDVVSKIRVDMRAVVEAHLAAPRTLGRIESRVMLAARVRLRLVQEALGELAATLDRPLEELERQRRTRKRRMRKQRVHSRLAANNPIIANASGGGSAAPPPRPSARALRRKALARARWQLAVGVVLGKRPPPLPRAPWHARVRASSYRFAALGAAVAVAPVLVRR